MTKKKLITIAGSVILIAVVAGLVIPRVLGWNEEEVIAEVAPTVTVEKPQIRSIEQTSELIGTIEPDSIVYVTPLGSGEVTSINVQTGDVVTAGQLICVIDTKLVESSRISSETARVSYEEAKKNLDRYSVLYAAGDMAEADYQSLVDKVELARLQYENAKVAYNIQLESSQVTSPIAGRVESLDISVHDMVSTQTNLCVISGEGGKSVEFYVPERIVSGLSVGDNLTVEKDGTDKAATITEVNSMIDQASGLFKVKASIPDGNTLATGSSVKLNVVSSKAENVLSVPVDSIYYDGGDSFVYTYVNGTVKKVAVTVGIADDTYAEVKAGIAESDLIINTWTSELYDGSEVTLSDETEEKNQETQAQTADGQTEAETEGAAAETSVSAQ